MAWKGLAALALAVLAVGTFLRIRDRGGAVPEAAETRRGEPRESLRAPKAHFMPTFVAALAVPPANLMPAPAYASLLKEGAAVPRCADCHAGKDYDATEWPDVDPQPFRMDRNFMVPLMEKWVARLNKRHAGRLRKEVTCTDCHAIDPRDEAYRATIAPLMGRFVSALTAPPRNANPAKGWKPLLKAPEAPSNLCAVCHVDGREAPPDSRSGAPEPDRAFMIRLMERWVHELNRRMKDRLVRAVGCTDCHEIDPRK